MVRRPHTKSRRGCFTCKKRRIKCDERKPKCENCVTREAVCAYPATAPLTWVGDKEAAIQEEERAPSSAKPSPPAYTPSSHNGRVSTTHDPSLNLENVELIINWFTKTVYTANSPSNQRAIEVCQTVILEQAMQHHFLLHGLLALSALHLAESHSNREEYTRIATAHHTQGLALYHSILANINEENYAASVAFSGITIMFSFGLSRPDPAKTSGLELVDDLAQILLLMKGWVNVYRVANDLDSSISPSNSDNNALPNDLEIAFHSLEDLNQGSDREIYLIAISSLRATFNKLSGAHNDDPHLPLEWLNALPEDFVRLIRERQSLALAVVGYYCVVLDTISHVWWVQGWGKALFKVIRTSIDYRYHDVLEWPRKVIASDK